MATHVAVWHTPVIIIIVLPPVAWQSNRARPMPDTADCDAIILAVVRYWVEQAVFIMVHGADK